jgi:hypothetical protein
MLNLQAFYFTGIVYSGVLLLDENLSIESLEKFIGLEDL